MAVTCGFELQISQRARETPRFTAGTLFARAASMRVAVLLVALAGCATRYEYSFREVPLQDPDLAARIAVDSDAGALRLELENRTDQMMQVGWTEIAITRLGGRGTTLRPDVDLGWIPPGERVAAHLLRIALPREGGDAAANDGRQFRVDVPVVVRREPKVYHFTLVAHLREI